MTKRKYAVRMEDAKAFECTRRTCKWQGAQEEKAWSSPDSEYGTQTAICPNCSNDQFYGLLEAPKK